MGAKVVTASEHKEVSTSNFIALVAIGTMLVILASGYFGSQLIKANLLNGKVIAGKYDAKKDVKQKLIDAKTLVTNYNDLSSQKKQLINSALPPTADFPQIISLIESAGNASGVVIKSVTVDQTALTAAAAAEVAAAAKGATPVTVAANTPQPFVFTSSIKGSYDHTTEFFKSLELSARPMKVTAFELRGDSGVLVGSLTVQTYYQGKADISDKEAAVK